MSVILELIVFKFGNYHHGLIAYFSLKVITVVSTILILMFE
jgi:hypothetical protein